MIFIKARCLCPTHGKLSLDDIIIKNGCPICRKCSTPLEFTDVRPKKPKLK